MEVCVDCLESAKNAIEGGATRLEVCSALSEGGLTPTPGLAQTIKSFSPVPIYAMLRIRAGDFVYSKEEITATVLDLNILKDHGVDGFVFGALTSENKIDIESCEAILSSARPLPVTFHRAFDEVDNPLRSLEILANLGFERILTSGQKDTAEEGLELIQTLVRKAQNSIIIMPGSGITKENILKVKTVSGAKEFHASAKKKMAICKKANKVKIGSSEESYVAVTNSELVREMVKIITTNSAE